MYFVLLIFVFVFITILVFFEKRFLQKMAAFFTWIIGNVVRSKSKETDENIESVKPVKGSRNETSKSNKSKSKKSQEPCFNTNLNSPIDEIIAEELSQIEENAEQNSPQLIRTRHRASKKIEKKSSQKPGNKTEAKLEKVFDSTSLNNTTRTKRELELQTPEDDIGFSFIPVRKGSRKPKSVEIILQTETVGSKEQKAHKTSEKDKSKLRFDQKSESSIIGHYRPKRSRSWYLEEQRSLTITKESKKVDSTLSYANVTSQSCNSLEYISSGISSEAVDKESSLEFQALDFQSSLDHKKTVVDAFHEKDSEVSISKEHIERDDFVNVDKTNLEDLSCSIDFVDDIVSQEHEFVKIYKNPKELSIEPPVFVLTESEILKSHIKSVSTDIEKNGTEIWDADFVKLEKPISLENELEAKINTLDSTLNVLLREKRDLGTNSPDICKTNLNTEISNCPTLTYHSSQVKKLDIKSVEDLNQEIQSSIETLKSTEDTADITLENRDTSEAKVEHNITSSKMSNQKSQIRILQLNHQEFTESTLFRLETGWILEFRLGPSLLGRKVNLFCNHPKEVGGIPTFERKSYTLIPWFKDEGCEYSDDTALQAQIKVKLAGSFHYYFTYENETSLERQGSGFFLVDPVLKYGKDEELLLDCIQCQTILSKNLGSFDTFEDKLKVSKESGYNMIHFTPIQELGVSNSAYSLSEQLKLNPIFKKKDGKVPTYQDFEKLISKIRKDWKMISICDIVLNHTANESLWIKEHPEVTYNCSNCKHMRPAYMLDAAFHQFSMDVKKGFYETKGIPDVVCEEDHLNAIRHRLHTEVLSELKLQELFICDVKKYVAEFMNLARHQTPSDVQKPNNVADLSQLVLIQDPEYRRLSSTVDIKLALKLYNTYRSDCFDEDSRLRKCSEEFKRKLDELNQTVVAKIQDHLKTAVENTIAGIRYFRVQHDGPKFTEITIDRPLIYRYFTDYENPKTIKEHEDIMFSDNGKFLMAHNGWVINADPLKNFAEKDSDVYIRRELIAWGDSVKLRYGDKPADSPYLWEHMKKYVEQTAKIFDGVRLDNCHSTPIVVAEYLLDCARRVRPNLYVVAELFTNSDHTDNIFVNRLGITSLIREAMSAWDSHEQGRLVHRYGGLPVGSFVQPHIRPLVPSIAHALFLDLSHDNPSPVEKRCVFDLLPSTALVNMACCASGSNRGYDELVPHHIHVVEESREYTEWTNDDHLAKNRYVGKSSGIVKAKKELNDLHFKLGAEGFNQVYVDQMDADIVAVTRHNPEIHQSYILVAFTSFRHPQADSDKHQRGIKPLRFEGVLDEIVLEAGLSHVISNSSDTMFAKFEKFDEDPKYINGLSEYEVKVKQHIQISQSDIFEQVNSGAENATQLNFKNFKPGMIVVVKTSLPETMKDAVKKVRSLMGQFSITKETELFKIINRMNLADLNRAIYRCDQEERNEGKGFDAYGIPGFEKTVYSGFQGFMSLLAKIRPNNDLGHPMCANLRDGNWMIDYIWQRLKLDEGTKELGLWIEENVRPLKQIPRYLIPCYFDIIITGIYILLMEQSYSLMSGFVKNGSAFVKGLSLGSLQFAAYIKSADLPVLSPNLAPPKPPTRTDDNGKTVQGCVTLSAGLPHFSVGYMRNWGRDTFISLRGLFLLTGRFQDARYHILGYGACLRHGLIPNLLDGGRNSRFNCRDAVWWWMYCIKCYTEHVPNGSDILNDKISRIFPTDDSPAREPGQVEQTLAEVMQEALNVHFQGLAFRERNAGRQIDEHMTDNGFNNRIGVHPDTGFVFGGNVDNCGTWMDKMGSTDKANIRGKPATPRDGSACEIVGLSKAVVSWLHELYEQKKYEYDGVERTHTNGNVTKWTFKKWADTIQNNFEKCFWINEKPTRGEAKANLINKRGIYKDCYGATQEWTDFQLRCNFPVMMVAAPELFDPKHAWTALQNAEKYLLGPLGMKTLDPEDWAYRGDYDNSNDSKDHNVAHGINYHQGPEWVWPIGYFLRAKLIFAAKNNKLSEAVASTKQILSKHFTELQNSDWRGLPELTNHNGSYCKDSSRTQAWSMACVLEVLYDLQKIEAALS